MTAQILYAFITIIVGVGGCFGYFYGSNWLLDWAFPANASNDASAVRNLKIQSSVRPWLFLGPALLLLTVYLIYPVIETIWLSFHGKSGEDFVGLSNYVWAFSDAQFRQSIFNNLIWLLVVPAACTLFGLGHRGSHGPHLVGKPCPFPGIPAAGHFVCRCKRHLEIRL